MYARFTDRARKVMRLATQEAVRLDHRSFETEHILLGLLKEGQGVAAHVLVSFGIDLPRARQEVEKLAPPGPPADDSESVPEGAGAKQVVADSMDEAQKLGHNYVGTEHLLLGLLRQQHGTARQVLNSLGLELDDVRQEVLNLLGHGA